MFLCYDKLHSLDPVSSESCSDFALNTVMTWGNFLYQDQEKGEQEKELILQDEISSKVWVCTSTHSSTKVMVLDASQPSDLLDSFYACNTHVVCIASVPGMFRFSHNVYLCRVGWLVSVFHP